MKKVIAIITIIAVIITSFAIIITVTGEPQEQTEFSIADRIRSFMLENNPEALERVEGIHQKSILESIDIRVSQHTRRYSTAEAWLSSRGDEILPELERITTDATQSLTIKPDLSFVVYELITSRFSKQYAESSVFSYLVSDNRIWIGVSESVSVFYYEDGTFYRQRNRGFLGTINSSSDMNIRRAAINFLQDPDAIEEMILREIDEKIVDVRIVRVAGTTSLFLQGENTDFVIILNAHNMMLEHGSLERFKIYPMADMLSMMTSTGIFAMQALDHKPTFTAEAEALQAMGLLRGTDRGLDLLRPLTRIEAATMLVRALGLDDEPTAVTSQFVDIGDVHWGMRYANIAADRGITRGVGYGYFAPSAIVTADQFATLVLRSAGEPEFNWEEAINIMIEREIITEENADTMDLFTRGDMAKILYEAIAAGMM